jgi:hypothetical protein
MFGGNMMAIIMEGQIAGVCNRRKSRNVRRQHDGDNHGRADRRSLQHAEGQQCSAAAATFRSWIESEMKKETTVVRQPFGAMKEKTT